MDLPEKVEISPQVIANKVGDELVILDLAGGSYFGLDAVGTRIWQLLREGKDPAEACEVMMNEYDVSREELERDIIKLLEELSTRELIRPAYCGSTNSK